MAMAILSIMAMYSFMNMGKLISTSEWNTHTNDVLYQAERVLADAVNMDAGQRGYSLTGNREFLDFYSKSYTELKGNVKLLTTLMGDHTNPQRQLSVLEKEVQELMVFSSEAVNLRYKSFEAAVVFNATMRGKRHLDNIRRIVEELEIEQKTLLNKRRKNKEDQIREYYYSFIGLLTVTGAILMGLLYTLNTNMGARNEIENRLLSASAEIEDLYNNAPCGYHSLNSEGVFVAINNTLVKWLGFEDKAQVVNKLNFADVISENDKPLFLENHGSFKESGFVSNVELNFKRRNGSEFPVILNSTAVYDTNGNFLKIRSTTVDNTERKHAETEVRDVNKELEAFTYSVSHDLRAPLRSIDGYSRILQEDYQDKLDAEGKRLIHVIINNAKRMGKLIDDLLDFSRLGRKDPQCSFIDMTSMVRAIANELAGHEPERKISLTVHPLERCYGDVDMLRQVWINLVSNAIKYTGRNPLAIIEISSSQENMEVQYKIRDNGVGFEMQYVHKLFGVFQRLHRIQDFSGTGVGLAIVKRIVNRHHGRVWAEGDVDKGATFYFTIPNHD